MQINIFNKLLLTIIVLTILSSCKNENIVILSNDLKIEFDQNLFCKINSTANGANSLEKSFKASEYIETKDFSINRFTFLESSEETINSVFDKGRKITIKGVYKNKDIEITKIVAINVFESLPNIAIFNISYINTGSVDLLIKKWVNNQYNILAQESTPNFWSFQGSSSSKRADWVLPLKPGFRQKNFMGMNDSDYGGGIPFLDIWRKDCGIAIGHLAMVPKEVSFPVDFDKYSDFATIGIEKEFSDFQELNTRDTLKTLETFVAVHQGDYFSILHKYSQIMQKKGIRVVESEPDAFEPIWCGWGYMRSFTKNEILGTLPKVKELGIKWAVIDDGYQIAEGDWRIDTKRFKGGERDIKELVSVIHKYGLKAKLWWAPLAADPGTEILKKNPSVLLINREGAPQYITWWDSYYLSPAYEGTFNYTKETVKMMMKDWGFDGLKLDGQHMNAVPADYNWNRPLEHPEKSIEMLPDFFKMIYQTAREIKPQAVIENCPCGCCMSFYNMPYTNQFVSSDPTSSWQIRLKGKTYKAIMPQTAYYGDHVELSDNGDDFASSFGIGAVLGTKFTWPKNNPDVKDDYLLTPEKEQIWKKWFSLYNKKMLSKGEYLGNLYDIGYDIPETHVIKKENKMYYALYNANWKGIVSLKGLSTNVKYNVKDYYNDTDLGTIEGSNPNLNIEFKDFLLLELTPEKQ